MNEKTIYQVSLITMIIGFLILYFYADEFHTVAIEQIDTFKPGEEITIEGQLTQLTKHDKVYFATIQGQQTISTPLIIFEEQEIFLEEGNYVQITGTIEEYKGKKEIIAHKVILK